MRKEMMDVSKKIEEVEMIDEIEIEINLGIILGSLVFLIDKAIELWPSQKKLGEYAYKDIIKWH